MKGTMIWFNREKGFGFIRTEEGERLYVARSGFLGDHVPADRCAGRQVTFERVEEQDDARAVDVVFPVAAEPRRARLRHARGVR
jgi:cold shock protein